MPAKRKAAAAAAARCSAPLLKRPRKSRNEAQHASAVAKAKQPTDVSGEIYLLLLDHLTKSQRSLILLSMACRAARDAVLRNPKLWFDVLKKNQNFAFVFHNYYYTNCGPAVVRKIPMTPYPNFKRVEGYQPAHDTHPPPASWRLKQYEWPHMLPPDRETPLTPEEVQTFADHALRRARVGHFDHCGLCGTKRLNIPVWGLGCRACSSCLKANLVSSEALLAEFGLNYAHHMKKIAGRVFYFQCAERSLKIAHLTDNPVDFTEKARNHLTFFWRPHLAKIFDLSALRFEHRANAGAASVLTSRVRALFVRVGILQKYTGCTCGKIFHTGSCFNYLLDAKAKPNKQGHHSAHPCEDHEKVIIKTWLPPAVKTRMLIEPECRAYRLLQRTFLAFRGRSTVLCAKDPRRTVERLRTSEALRGESVAKSLVTFPWNSEFKQWLDMVPSLIGK